MFIAAVFNMTTFVVLIIVLAISKSSAAQANRKSASSNYDNQMDVHRSQSDIIFPSNLETRNNYQHFDHNPQYHDLDFHHFHHPHHHLHDRGFQMENDNEPSGGNAKETFTNNSSMIPLDLIWRVNNYTDVNDLLLNLVDGNVEEDPLLASRFGEGERSAAIMPKSAECMPELQTVHIAPEDDPSILYIPCCTRIERCGGCCKHKMLSCQPKDSETVSYQIVKTQFTGGSKLKFISKDVVFIERHTKCKCDCRVQEKDCNSFQEYRKSECRCACTNTDEEKKCYKENATKLWNPDICACQCRDILQCSTGYTFDMLRCRCVPNAIRRRFAELEDQEKTET